MSKRKLLLADDSITIQKVVNLTFADEGIEVISVGDGDSAMQKFDEFMPDLVMADVNMPGLTGYEICQIIKQNDDTRRIPVILLVGSFEPFDEAEAARVGADDYLTKPFQSIRQLVNKVTDLLNRSEKTDEAPPIAAETQSEPETSSQIENKPPVDMFADTLEFNNREKAQTQFDNREEEQTQFGDAGMDDEMIESSPANDYVSESNSFYQAETTIDYAKTQPLSAEELKGFSIISESPKPEPEEQSPGAVAETTDDQPAPETTEPETYQNAYTGQTNYSEETFGNEPETLEEPVAKVESETVSEPESEEEKISEPELDYYAPAEDVRSETTPFANEYSTPEVAGEETPESEFTEPEVIEPEIAEPAVSEVEASYWTHQPETEALSETEPVGEEESAISNEPETSFVPETEESETSPTATSEAQETETYPVEPSAAEEETYPVETSAAEERETYPVEIFESRESETSPVETSEPEESKTEEFEPAPVEEEKPVAATENAPALSFDDGDLLELPPLVEETGIRPQAFVQEIKPEFSPEPEVVESETAEPEVAETEAAEVSEPQPTAFAETAQSFQSFPPELIEAIAQKVAERISDKAIREIAWEVVPQMTELIIKKMAEEKLKDS